MRGLYCLVLAAAILGCGPDRTVQTPADPAPPPTREPDSLEAAAPAP
jgi:hypothetical protein